MYEDLIFLCLFLQLNDLENAVMTLALMKANGGARPHWVNSAYQNARPGSSNIMTDYCILVQGEDWMSTHQGLKVTTTVIDKTIEEDDASFKGEAEMTEAERKQEQDKATEKARSIVKSTGVYNLSETQVTMCKDVYDQIANLGRADGVMDKDELLLAIVGVKPEAIASFAKIDANSDGSVELEEWMQYVETTHGAKGTDGDEWLESLMIDLEVGCNQVNASDADAQGDETSPIEGLDESKLKAKKRKSTLTKKGIVEKVWCGCFSPDSTFSKWQ